MNDMPSLVAKNQNDDVSTSCFGLHFTWHKGENWHDPMRSAALIRQDMQLHQDQTHQAS
jgi:hypothetical protein